MNARDPCPTINVTEPGKYRRKYYYLDSLGEFLKDDVTKRWGSVIFSDKYPGMHK